MITDTRLAELARQPEADWDLGYGTLLIAAAEYPDMDVGFYLSRLDELGHRAVSRIPETDDWSERLSAFNDFLFHEEGFQGNDTDYFDPRNSYLNDVLDEHVGIPISLSVVMMEVGRRAGFDFQGVSFPGHFLVKMAMPDGEVVLDPFHGGLALTVEQLEARLTEMYPDSPRPVLPDVLGAANKREILCRMLRNLKRHYLHEEENDKALNAMDQLLILNPANIIEQRDRGEHYLRMEAFRAALADFSRCLEIASIEDDVEILRMRVSDLRMKVARLN
ncbi:MAG: tetratricopeptide repeat protein [Thiobacillaceae bacterium]|jgi:regulator of sirC expression with transglutaminase-like and TPR domain